MPYPSGLSAQVMAAAETTVGTPVTVANAYEFLSESINFDPTDLDGAGLAAGQAYERGARNTRSRVSASGDLVFEHMDQGHMGLLWKHALGSPLTTPVVIGATTAYDQYHVDGPHAGLGMTMQVGRPTGLGVVKPFTYSGGKVTGWEFSCNDGQVAQMKLSYDFWNEATATALATASYTAGAGIFSFADCSVFKIGGTASTTAGKTTVASGVQVASIMTGVTITGANPMKVDSYGLGNAGVKSEQKENAFPQLTGQLVGEFTNQSEFYDVFKANTAVPLQISFLHGDAGGGNAYLLDFIFPQVKFKKPTINASGPDVLTQTIPFKVYDDATTNPTVQVHLVSKDSTL